MRVENIFKIKIAKKNLFSKLIFNQIKKSILLYFKIKFLINLFA